MNSGNTDFEKAGQVVLNLTDEQLHRVLEVLQDLAHNGHKVVVAACTEPSLASYADVSLQLRRAK